MTSDATKLPVVVGISGGSGSVLARRTIDRLLEMEVPVSATCSSGALQTWRQELSEPFKEVLAAWQKHPLFSYHPVGDLGAPTASGTFVTQGMIVVPCSMASVAAIARGVGTNLLHRSADVCLKEGRKLVRVPRETPLSAIHLENMLILARLGVTILSPEPAFYLRPKTIEDVIEYVVERALMAVGVLSRLGTALSYKPMPHSD